MTYLKANHWLNPKVQVTNHSSVQSSSNSSNTNTKISGSDIYYTADSSANSIVYEISFYGQKTGRCDVSYMLQEDVSGDFSGSWNPINQRYIRNISNTGTYQRYRWLNRFQFIIPAGSGQRRFALFVGSHAINRNINLHKVPEYDGAVSSSTFFSTHLIVYSV